MSQTLQNPRETVRAKLPHYLEPKEIDVLIEYAADSSRMAANFMLTMWRAGLRVSEAINLQARDLRFKTDRPQIHIRNAKGHKERFVPAHPELQRTLKEHCLEACWPDFSTMNSGAVPLALIYWQCSFRVR